MMSLLAGRVPVRLSDVTHSTTNAERLAAGDVVTEPAFLAGLVTAVRFVFGHCVEVRLAGQPRAQVVGPGLAVTTGR